MIRVSPGESVSISLFPRRAICIRRDMQIISPLVLGVAPRILPVPILILVAVRSFHLGSRLGVAFGDLVLAAAFDDDHGGVLVAGLSAGSTRRRGGRCRCCSTVSVILYEERTSLIPHSFNERAERRPAG